LGLVVIESISTGSDWSSEPRAQASPDGPMDHR